MSPLVTSQDYTPAVNEVHINYNTSCELRVLSTKSGYSESWDGDILFYANNRMTLLIGLHPEHTQWLSGELAIKNDVFRGGTIKWNIAGVRWVDVNFPDRNKKGDREYIFNFNNTEKQLTISSKGNSEV